MLRRLASVLALAAAVGYGAFGVRAAGARVRPVPTAPDELRGAWHVHTTRSDGRGTLREVVAAARDAGLSFLVVTDHNVIAPEEQGWHDGVLVVQGVEISTRHGHVVALGIDLAAAQAARKAEDPLGSIAAAGGRAVLAHPLHPRRAFRGLDGAAPWAGFEVFSNDTAWYQALAERAWGRIAGSVALLPFDGGRAVLDLAAPPREELARLDAARARARAAGDRRQARALLCSVDAHGYPSYRAAFAAATMHVPVRPTGDGAADAAAVADALLEGDAACVLAARGAVSRVRFTGGEATALDLELAAAAGDAEVRLVRDGVTAVERPLALRAGANHVPLATVCGGPCAPGDYRLELWRSGAPWLFTNWVRIE
ncbi:MAG TPA: PHP domain-containing protein [Anaeromyxobacter sp.]|nr:PHP domain-containing protein [Anaeromyxobacter sp.]